MLQFLIGIGFTLLCLFLVLGWNPDPPHWSEVIQLILHPQTLIETDRYILLHMRLPRIILAFLVGMALSVSGLAMQGLFRNPLVDPFVIGVSGGGALGAGLALLFNFHFRWGWLSSLPIAAFLTSLTTMYAVYKLGSIQGRIHIDRLLLAGVAMSALSSAVLSLMLVLKGEGMEGVVYWIMGSFSGRTWEEVLLLIPFLLLGTAIICFYLNGLNALQLGEESACYLGIDTDRLKAHLIVGATLLSASVVSVSGVIGFIGLIVPHMSRFMMRTSDFRYLMIPTMFVGSILLVLADTFSRTLLPAQEIPVGIFTAMLGVPFFLFLLSKQT